MLWSDELGFSNWLHNNIGVLNSALGLTLISRRREAPVGRLSADLLAELEGSAEPVIIENQIYPANHGHFGQILTYAAHYDARMIIWIATSFRNEYRSAIAWLNSLSDKHFYAIELRGDGTCTPGFEIVAGPEAAHRLLDTSSAVRVARPQDATRPGAEGLFVPAPFAVRTERWASPGQVALDTIFERIAVLLAQSAQFPNLRKPTGDRNYFAFSKGPVARSEWSIVFTDSEVRVELVFNDEATAIDDLQMMRALAATLSDRLGHALDVDGAVGRKKQKAIISRALSYQERDRDAEAIAAWCVRTVCEFKNAVEALSLFC